MNARSVDIEMSTNCIKIDDFTLQHLSMLKNIIKLKMNIKRRWFPILQVITKNCTQKIE